MGKVETQLTLSSERVEIALELAKRYGKKTIQGAIKAMLDREGVKLGIITSPMPERQFKRSARPQKDTPTAPPTPTHQRRREPDWGIYLDSDDLFG